jgi:undecaprenyl-diphosphatase
MSGGRRAAGGGLRSPFFLARRPGAGIALIGLGISLFLLLADGIRPPGAAARADLRIVEGIHAAALRSSPFIQGAMAASFILGQYGVILAGLLLAGYFFLKRRRPELVMILVAWLGFLPIWFALTDWFHRSRPGLARLPWRHLREWGFPSGHAFSAFMLMGLLAYFLWPSLSSRFAKAALVTAEILGLLLIGFSRVFEGDHYPSDVLAGYALGLAWITIVVLAVETRAKREAGRFRT